MGYLTPEEPLPDFSIWADWFCIVFLSGFLSFFTILVWIVFKIFFRFLNHFKKFFN